MMICKGLEAIALCRARIYARRGGSKPPPYFNASSRHRGGKAMHIIITEYITMARPPIVIASVIITRPGTSTIGLKHMLRQNKLLLDYGIRKLLPCGTEIIKRPGNGACQKAK